MQKITVAFIPNELEGNGLENNCLLAQLMQFITIIGIRELDKEASCNNEEGVNYEQVA